MAARFAATEEQRTWGWAQVVVEAIEQQYGQQARRRLGDIDWYWHVEPQQQAA